MSNKAHKNPERTQERSVLLSKNLEWLLAIKKIDVKFLAQKTGISVTNLNNIRRNAANPTLETLEAIANYFNLSVSELLENEISEDKRNAYQLITIPLLEIDQIEDFLEGMWNGEKVAISVPSNPKNMQRLAIQLKNNSFSPFYEKDTLFILNLNLSPQDGDIVAIKVFESPCVIRKILFNGNNICMYYPTMSDEKPLIENKTNIKIIGVVEKIIKNR